MKVKKVSYIKEWERHSSPIERVEAAQNAGQV